VGKTKGIEMPPRPRNQVIKPEEVVTPNGIGSLRDRTFCPGGGRLGWGGPSPAPTPPPPPPTLLTFPRRRKFTNKTGRSHSWRAAGCRRFVIHWMEPCPPLSDPVIRKTVPFNRSPPTNMRPGARELVKNGFTNSITSHKFSSSTAVPPPPTRVWGGVCVDGKAEGKIDRHPGVSPLRIRTTTSPSGLPVQIFTLRISFFPPPPPRGQPPRTSSRRSIRGKKIFPSGDHGAIAPRGAWPTLIGGSVFREWPASTTNHFPSARKPA